MEYKIRQLSFWERANLLDLISQSQDNMVILVLELLARGVEFEGCEFETKTIAGRQIKRLTDASLEKLCQELSGDEIAEAVRQVIEANKLPFFGTSGKDLGG